MLLLSHLLSLFGCVSSLVLVCYLSYLCVFITLRCSMCLVRFIFLQQLHCSGGRNICAMLLSHNNSFVLAVTIFAQKCFFKKTNCGSAANNTCDAFFCPKTYGSNDQSVSSLIRVVPCVSSFGCISCFPICCVVCCVSSLDFDCFCCVLELPLRFAARAVFASMVCSSSLLSFVIRFHWIVCFSTFSIALRCSMCYR